MAKQHYEADIKVLFMGKHPGEIIADIDWDENGRGILTGQASMKMLKTFLYPYADGSVAQKTDEGGLHADAKLVSMFGNGSLDCTIDLAPDGTLKGSIPLLKGIVLTLDGKLR